MKDIYVKSIERKNYFFTFIVSLWSHGFYLRENLGVGLMNSFFKYEGNAGILYNRDDEVDVVYEKIWHEVVSNEKLLNNWYEKALKLNSEADEILKNSNSFEISVEVYDRHLEHFINIFEFSTVIPFLVLASIERNEKDVAELQIVNVIRKNFEEIRGQTRYPQLIAVIFDRYFRELVSKTGLNFDLLTMVTPYELRAWLFEDKNIESEILEKRKKWSVVSNLPNLETKIEYENDSDIAKKIPVEEIKFLSEIKGKVAFPGKVSGTARIVNTTEDIQKVKEGDILISINTNPALMPAIIKCSAIVTDEGGIMCHASIISRELKKPCIVGTQNATKIINDNDFIEVDGDSGIVKITKNAER